MDENGVAIKTVYEIKGNDVTDTKTVFLKAGEYYTSIQNNATVRNASWDITGIAESQGNNSTKSNSAEKPMTTGEIFANESKVDTAEAQKRFTGFFSIDGSTISYTCRDVYDDDELT